MIIMPRRKPIELISDVFDLHGIFSQTTVTITASKHVHIENHKGLLAYEDDLISTSCGDKIISIRGAGLVLRAMSASELSVSGEITSVEYM
jgi:sporulation protein YqfC